MNEWKRLLSSLFFSVRANYVQNGLRSQEESWGKLLCRSFPLGNFWYCQGSYVRGLGSQRLPSPLKHPLPRPLALPPPSLRYSTTRSVAGSPTRAYSAHVH